MNLAHDAAPETDRLVGSVLRDVRPKHGPRLEAFAGELGLDSLYLLPQLGDFLLANALTPTVANLRLRYGPRDPINARLDELQERELIEQKGSHLGATASLRPLLVEIQQAQADVAADKWGEHDAAVATASRLSHEVSLAASDDHVVAVAHRNLPDSSDRYRLAHQRLFNLRFIRQHDHSEAWLARGLTEPTIVIMTSLWRGGEAEDRDGGFAQLVERGFAEDDPPRLTGAGRVVRDEIEADTNRRAQATFDVLNGNEGAALLAAMGELPSD